MNERRWLVGILVCFGMTCLAASDEPQRPPQADLPADFDGSVLERLAKHEQYVAFIRYEVAVQLEYAAKEDDIGAALAKCTNFIDDCINQTATNSSTSIRLKALEADINKEIDAAKKVAAAIGDDNESSADGTKAVALKERQRLRYEQLKAGYMGVNKLLKDLEVPLSKAATLWQVGGVEMRPDLTNNLMQRYRDWCAWNSK